MWWLFQIHFIQSLQILCVCSCVLCWTQDAHFRLFTPSSLSHSVNCGRSVVSDSLQPHGLCPPGSSVQEFSRQEYWSGLPFPSPGDLPDPGFKPASPALAGRSSTVEALITLGGKYSGHSCKRTLMLREDKFLAEDRNKQWSWKSTSVWLQSLWPPHWCLTWYLLRAGGSHPVKNIHWAHATSLVWKSD